MAVDYLNHVDLHNNQLLNAVIQPLASDPSSPSEGQIYVNTVSHTLKYYNGTVWITLGRIDQISLATASLDINSQKIVNLGNGTATSDAINKGQLDGAVAGLSWKQAARAATTANGTLASAFANGSVIDGVTLATGDRILLKNQTSGGENGIYTVNASGAPTRSTDCDSAAEILAAAVFITEGTTLQDTAWVDSTNAPITLGTTATVWVQFTGGSVTAGTGMTQSGNTLNVIAGSSPSSGGPGGGLVVAADDLAIDTDVVVRKFSASVGDGSTTSIVVTHNLNTKDATVQLYDNTTPFGQVHPEVRMTSVNTVTLVFSVAPTTNQYRVVVHA